MRLLVVLDRGHGQKGPHDDFDPGVVAGALKEVDLTREYMISATDELERLGHKVVWLDSGTYDERHRSAIVTAKTHADLRTVYVQCHVNAGGGRYGLVEYDARSSWGQTAAALLADALDELPEIPTARTLSLHAGERGWVCIDDIFASPTMLGLIFEPGFIDGPTHAPLWTRDGLDRVGKALALGLHRYGMSILRRAA